MKEELYARLPQALLPWYEKNKRDLPWRQDRQPYHVWLSEIMLQQTRVEAVKGYYRRFLNALPNICALSQCDDDTLHKLWEGLGYYNRVKNLKKCAIAIMEHHGGNFPTTYEEVLALPGIGPYTAGAICSICYDLPTPAVDGNVLRILSRITADPTPIDRPSFQANVRVHLAKVYPAQAGTFTQALMELGATVCGPNKRPDCQNCPCRDFCRGAKLGCPENFPVKSPKKPRKTEELTLFLLSCDGRFALEKRPNGGLLAGLWQFPNVPGNLSPEKALLQTQVFDLNPKELLLQLHRSHIFTHVQWNMTAYLIRVQTPGSDFLWLTPDEIENTTALPTAFRQFWEELKQANLL